MQSCECKLWDKNIDQYNDMFNFVEKYHGPSYEGDEYSFCPWCGTDLREKEEDVDEEEFEDWDEDEEDEDDDVIDTTPMHGEDDEDEDEEEEEEETEYEYELEFEAEKITYPVMVEGWVNQN